MKKMNSSHINFNNEQYMVYNRAGNANSDQIRLYKKCIGKLKKSLIDIKGNNYYESSLKALDDNHLEDSWRKIIARFFTNSVKSDKTKKEVKHNTTITRNSLQIHPTSIYIANLMQRELSLPIADKEVHLLLGIIYEIIDSISFDRSGSKLEIESKVNIIISVIKEVTSVLQELNRKEGGKKTAAIGEITNIIECLKKESIEMIMKSEQTFETLNYTAMADKLDEINNKFKIKEISNKSSKVCDFFKVVEIAYSNKLNKPNERNINELRKIEYMLREKIIQVKDIFSVNMNETVSEHEISLITKYPEINVALKDLDECYKEFKRIALNSYSVEHLTESEVEGINHYLKIYDNLKDFQDYITDYKEFVAKSEKKLIYKGILNSSESKTNAFVSNIYQKVTNTFTTADDEMGVLRKILEESINSLNDDEKNQYIIHSRKKLKDLDLGDNYSSLENDEREIRAKLEELKLCKENLMEAETNPYSRMNSFLNKYKKENRPENQNSHSLKNPTIFHKNHKKINDQIEALGKKIEQEKNSYISNINNYYEKIKSEIAMNKISFYFKKLTSSEFRKKVKFSTELFRLINKKNYGMDKVNIIHDFIKNSNDILLNNYLLNFNMKLISEIDHLIYKMNDYVYEVKSITSNMEGYHKAINDENTRILEGGYGEMIHKVNEENKRIKESEEKLKKELDDLHKSKELYEKSNNSINFEIKKEMKLKKILSFHEKPSIDSEKSILNSHEDAINPNENTEALINNFIKVDNEHEQENLITNEYYSKVMDITLDSLNTKNENISQNPDILSSDNSFDKNMKILKEIIDKDNLLKKNDKYIKYLASKRYYLMMAIINYQNNINNQKDKNDKAQISVPENLSLLLDKNALININGDTLTNIICKFILIQFTIDIVYMNGKNIDFNSIRKNLNILKFNTNESLHNDIYKLYNYLDKIEIINIDDTVIEPDKNFEIYLKPVISEIDTIDTIKKLFDSLKGKNIFIKSLKRMFSNTMDSLDGIKSQFHKTV